MSLRGWFSVQQLVLACLVGLIVGFGAFLPTAMDSQDQVLSMCYPGLMAGFDPWTGMAHGTTLHCPQLNVDGTQSSVTQYIPMPPDLATRRAIPVPLGFAVGAGLVLIVSTVTGVWQRRST